MVFPKFGVIFFFETVRYFHFSDHKSDKFICKEITERKQILVITVSLHFYLY